MHKSALEYIDYIQQHEFNWDCELCEIFRAVDGVSQVESDNAWDEDD